MNYAIVTVDTEGHDGTLPVEKLIWGETEQGKYGITKIMDICDSFGVKALFFVDLAECWDYGKDKIGSVICKIREHGHHVGVHVHPDHMADPKRLFLWEYTEDEQRRILTDVTSMYQEITGESPKFFRAGKYSANQTTLKILSELGYQFDFSQFYGQKWCKIESEVAINHPHLINGLIEIPVTSFSSAKLGSWEKYEKIDMELHPFQFAYATRQFAKKDDLIISLFLHSFSLVEWRKNPNEPKPSRKNIKKLVKALKVVKQQKNIEFCDAMQLGELAPGMVIETKEQAPEVQIRNPVMSYIFVMLTVFRISQFNKKARIVLGANIALAVLIVAILLFL